MREHSNFDIQQATADHLREVAERQYRDFLFLKSKEDIDDWPITQEIKLTVLTCQVQDISDIKRKLYRLGEDIAKFKSQRQLENIGENHG